MRRGGKANKSVEATASLSSTAKILASSFVDTVTTRRVRSLQRRGSPDMTR